MTRGARNAAGLAWACITLFLVGPAYGAPLTDQRIELPRLVKGEDYALVRKKLLASGWSPYHAADSDTCSEGDTRCAGRPEMHACSGSGRASCEFLWKKGQLAVAIMTIGEDTATLSGTRQFQLKTGSQEQSQPGRGHKDLLAQVDRLCAQSDDAVQAMTSTLFAQRFADAILSAAEKRGGQCAGMAQANESLMTSTNRDLISNIEQYKASGQQTPPAFLSLTYCTQYRSLIRNMASAGCVGTQ